MNNILRKQLSLYAKICNEHGIPREDIEWVVREVLEEIRNARRYPIIVKDILKKYHNLMLQRRDEK